MKRVVAVVSAIALVSLLLSVASASAQGPVPQVPTGSVGTAITYQGQLKNASGPVTGDCDLQFSLWDDTTDGNQVGPTQTQWNHAVDNGLFTVQLDFGSSAFEGNARWLQIAVRCPAGSGNYTLLTPRQPLTPAPYAIAADRLSWGASWTGNSGTGFTVSGGALGFYGSGSQYGIQGQATGNADAHGLYGLASATSGFADGVYGETYSKDGSGVVGFNASTTGGIGVFGQSMSAQGNGVWGTGPVTGTVGEATNTTGTSYGVYGLTKSSATDAAGVYGVSPAGRGVFGSTNTGYGLYGLASGAGGFGMMGYASAGSGNNIGVFGQSNSTSGRGLYGHATATTGNAEGVIGRSDSNAGYGVEGYTTAISGTTYGVYGQAFSPQGYGVYGTAPTTGIAGLATSNSSFAIGLYGQGTTAVYGSSPAWNGVGVLGYADTGENSFGVWGISHNGYAGYFTGKVEVTTNLIAGGSLAVGGNFSAGGVKAFKIDHPLNPDQQYLYHYAIEAPDVQNMYNGRIVLDAKGEAVVTLPDYFSALNGGEFRYTLTAIGAPMPNLYIAEEIKGNAFKIAGGVSGKKVSWTVFAQRNDPWLRDHPATDVVDKPATEAGTYIYPQGYGQPETKGVNYSTPKPIGGR
ncbi:hypothetical protein TFLX_03850 [Thermoflexales bacterium]|nr:hypothetical protein TFLX_03850 [Thermoflexales bacterium]